MAFPKFYKQTTMWRLTLSNDSFLSDCHISHFGQASETWKGFRTMTETTDWNYTTIGDWHTGNTRTYSHTGTSTHNMYQFSVQTTKVHNQLLRAKLFIPLSSVTNRRWYFRTWQPFPVVTFGRFATFGYHVRPPGGHSCHPWEVRGVRQKGLTWDQA